MHGSGGWRSLSFSVYLYINCDNATLVGVVEGFRLLHVGLIAARCYFKLKAFADHRHRTCLVCCVRSTHTYAYDGGTDGETPEQNV